MGKLSTIYSLEHSAAEIARWGVLVMCLLAGTAHAEPEDWRAAYAETSAQLNMRQIALDENYVLGINRFDLDSHTEILGWQLSNSMYFGRQSGEDSGLTFVWQKSSNQVSLSKDGLRLTRRF